MYRIGCSSWSFHRDLQQGRLDPEGWLRLCSEKFSLDGVELLDRHFPSWDTKWLAAIKKLSTKLGLSIYAYSVSSDFGGTTKREAAAQVEKVRAAIDTALFLGAPVVRVFAGWPKGDRDLSWLGMIDGLRAGAVYAADKGILLGLENHNHKGFTRTAEDLVRILTEVASEWLRVTLDTGDYITGLGPVNGYEAIEQMASAAVLVHAKLYDLGPDGSDPMQDWSRILGILGGKGYRGYLSIEYEGEEESMAAMVRGVPYLRRVCARFAERSENL